MSRAVIGLVACAALAAGLTALYRNRPSATTVAAPAQGQPPASGERGPTARAEPRPAPSPRPVRLAPRPGPLAVTDPSPATADQPEPEDGRAGQAPPRGRFPPLDELLEQDPPDTDWQESVQLAFKRQYGRFPGVDLVSTRCGRAVCRVEMNVPPDGAQAQAALNQLQEIPEVTGELTLDIDRSGDGAMAVLYFSRQGQLLPLASR